MKVNKHLIFAIAAGAGLVTSVVLAFKAGTKAKEILEEIDPDGDAPLINKAMVVGRTMGPAIAATALTGATIIAEVTGHEKEVRKLTTTLTGIKQRKEKIKQDFGKYRATVKSLGGPDMDKEIITEAADMPQEALCVTNDDDGEKSHVFMIDWLGDFKSPIYFETTWMKVYDAMETVNRIIADPTFDNRDYATMSDFLQAAGVGGYCDQDTDEAGWSAPVLAAECDAYWIDWTKERTVNSDGSNEVIKIIPSEYPNFNVEQYAEEAEARGYI